MLGPVHILALPSTTDWLQGAAPLCPRQKALQLRPLRLQVRQLSSLIHPGSTMAASLGEGARTFQQLFVGGLGCARGSHASSLGKRNVRTRRRRPAMQSSGDTSEKPLRAFRPSCSSPWGSVALPKMLITSVDLCYLDDYS